MPDNHELLMRWYDEVWNKGRRDAITEMLDPNCVLHDGNSHTTGIGPFQDYFDLMHAAFTEFRVKVEDVISDGDKNVVRWSASFRHTGPGMPAAPTGKMVNATGITIIRVKDGKFVEGWQNWDMLGVLEQIGALESASRPLTVSAPAGS